MRLAMALARSGSVLLLLLKPVLLPLLLLPLKPVLLPLLWLRGSSDRHGAQCQIFICPGLYGFVLQTQLLHP